MLERSSVSGRHFNISARDIPRFLGKLISTRDRQASIDLLVLDIGGVLTPDPWESILLSPTVGLAAQLDHKGLERIAQFLWQEFSRSPRHESEYWEAMASLAGTEISPSLVADIEERVLRPFPWSKQLLGLSQIQIGIISDNTSFWFAKQSAALKLSSLTIEPVLLSFEQGVTKKDSPDGLYERLATLTSPARALVVDDRAINIERAEALGFSTCTFVPDSHDPI